ncbi:MAG TPA: SOS response-associated peptidase [Blastocatellia bacterium]|nr:SOS response-associated peptidase [Blastocatellia bacterium]
MCGRFTQRKEAAQVATYYDIEEEQESEVEPRYNIAPQQMIRAVTADQRLVRLKWGLIPSWAKDPKIANNLINARAETLQEKPSFRTALAKRRCLIPADGWYEWKKAADGKQPFFFHRRDDALFSFAGLWEEWHSPEGETVKTCTIITTEPNELTANYHHRMPAILKRSDEALWLDASARVPDLLQLLASYPADDLEIYPVSKAVNSPGRDEAALVERAS